MSSKQESVKNHDFRTLAHQLVDWMADYLEQVESYPVKSQVAPNDILNQLPKKAPSASESFDTIFQDFQNIIMPGMTHWQHPKFFAYFPANSSEPSLLAEMLISTLAAQCMSWQTSPAATELEQRVMEWLRDMLALPDSWHGVIQDGASEATLTSILTAREKYSNYQINQHGYDVGAHKFVIYASKEVHSSIAKAVRISGLGEENLRLIDTDESQAMNVEKLKVSIEQDQQNGLIPLCVIAVLGTTGTTAIDPLDKIAELCLAHNIWLHVDAAYAGSALLLPEYQWMIKGIEQVDSFVVNPHKWMFTNFDCSAYFVRDKDALLHTFSILPEYLKTKEGDHVNNYRDWGIPLGRRFRALKLWFVIRWYGICGLQEKLRNHIVLARKLTQLIEQDPDFELMARTRFNLVCFRYHPESVNDVDELNRMNQNLLETLNATGEMYVTHTKLNENLIIRLCIGQTHVTETHMQEAWSLIKSKAQSI